jgi:hypothetical protein
MNRDNRDDTIPEAKRSEREGVDPKSQPGEFADDMRVNRFTPPPDPPAPDRDDDQAR